MARFVVIGGGVIGLCSAFSLVERGADVTVVEERGGAHGASVVNAGWIVPGLAEPVPSPGLVRTSLKWMLRSDSPLYIQPRAVPGMARWLLGFWRHCNAKDFHAGTEATAELGRNTLVLIDRMVEAGVSFEMHRDGILFAYLSRARMERELRSLESLRHFGYDTPPVMDGPAVREFEPALNAEIQGGFWLERERSVQPGSFAEGLRAWLEECGVEFRASESVTGFDRRGSVLAAVRTTAGAIPCDGAVIAAGAQSGQLSRLAGWPLPVQGGKGYCLDYAPPPVEVRHPIDLSEARVAITPFNGAVRLAGTMEFSGINEIVRQERVAAISRATSTMLGNWPADPKRATSIGSGLRPMTPDGIPVIGLLPGLGNLAVATGHGMLGLTLGASTGDIVARMLTESVVPAVALPFSPARFR